MNDILSENASAKVQEILVDQLGVQPNQITAEADIRADLGADSLDIVEIGMTVEETFNVSFPDEAMDRIHTVADLHEALAEHLQRTGQPA